MNKAILVSLTIFLCSCTQINSSFNYNWDLIIGQRQSVEIPTLFQTYQHTYLEAFVSSNASNNFIGCITMIKNQATLSIKQQNIFKAKEDTSKQQITVFNFTQLLKLDSFFDSSSTKNILAAFFSDGKVLGFKQQQNSLIQAWSIKIPFVSFQSGDLLSYQDSFLLITNAEVFHISKNGSYFKLANYEPYPAFYSSAKINQNKLCIAGGFLGISIYQINLIAHNLTLKYKLTVHFFGYLKERVLLSADEFDFDNETGDVFVISKMEGIKIGNIKNIQNNSLTLLLQPIKAEKCRNLLIMPYTVYVTCPDLVGINRTDLSLIRLPSVGFKPRQMIINDTRLYLFGNKNFGLFELNTNRMEQGVTNNIYEKFLIMGKMIYGFTAISVDGTHIVPQITSLNCISGLDSPEGQYKSQLKIIGSCQNLLYPLESKGEKGECTVRVPVIVRVPSLKKYDHLWLYILLGIIGSVVILGAVFLIVRNLKVNKMYYELEEEASNHLGSNKKEVVNCSEQ